MLMYLLTLQLKSKKLWALLTRSPLNYSVAHRAGSHRKLVSASGYPEIGFAFHDKETIGGGVVKRMLCEQVGLTEQEALDLI